MIDHNLTTALLELRRALEKSQPTADVLKAAEKVVAAHKAMVMGKDPKVTHR